ncbi:acyl-CoA dehydrogenase family protein [Rhodococcus opacus]|uniref:acyl-CoA dehydrogenase family protein n=1 Tax=Rhodococcus TaxID=1827 RepID=UPI0003097E21|nr:MULTISPECIES: acyl-CoA dehydrogenase family protein [Rhodococcus]MBA8964566.1 alkylation response protein AidB-like acyl-CoA dehydrogenase [Rhodococcus opacus]MBP2207472.1 alkylation response protein AidB-like acyl-CoA dehydrogenase [Rhodococcus opacus]MDI9941062.1 acyl-CoA dehydrogenase family protein [Rhodococcus sp. IEGM 1351]MDV6246795.1 acyl-CoA dehydrogenase family protein [Rhodococcus opacus]MDX5965442.1 acyl-CoA dehydrogenase family protein [Rhodococcus opacus]
MHTRLFSDEHEMFRETVQKFVAREITPHIDRWESDGSIDKDLWSSAAEHGLIGLSVPEDYGGAGSADYRFRCVVMDELAQVGAAAVNVALGGFDDLIGPYLVDLGTEEQKRRLLPKLCSGEFGAAIAMTEPGAGSDLRGIRSSARRDGDGWILNGRKTFITGGRRADLVIVVARTDPDAGARGFSLFLVDKGMDGFTHGRALDKLGQRAEDVSELFFDDVRVPNTHLLGEEGAGFRHLMERLPKERMSIAYYGLAAAEAALGWTIEYVKDRHAFGHAIAEFQSTKFTLADLSTELDVTRAFIDRAVLDLNEGRLSAVDAAKAKWWATELQQRVISRCLQLHGGYGYMREYPIARAFVDARVQTIYGGTTEIMKEIIGRELIAPAGR